MKKIVSFILALIVTFSLAACGDEAEKGAKPEANKTAENAAQKSADMAETQTSATETAPAATDAEKKSADTKTSDATANTTEVAKADNAKKPDKTTEKSNNTKTTTQAEKKNEGTKAPEQSTEKPDKAQNTEQSAKKPENTKTPEKSAEKTDNVKKTEQTTKKPETVKTPEATTKPTEDKPQKVETPKTTASTKKTDETKTLSVGANDGSKYENKYFGIGFNAPQGWTFQSNEKINEMNGLKGKAAGAETRKAIENANILYGMVAQGKAGTTSLMIEKLAGETAGVDEKKYMELSLAKTKAAMEKGGVTDINMQSGAIDIGERNINAVKMSYKSKGQVINQVVFCMKKDQHMAVVTIAGPDEEQTMAVLSQYHVIK